MSKTRQASASTYRYDPLNRLTATQSVQRFYNNTRIATEIEGERKTRFFETDSQPLALQQHGSDVGTTLLATDQQRSVLNSISPDGTQHAQGYTAFGYHANAALLNSLGFNGERPEPVTGHYLLGQGYRAFNPVLMRFNSPDSWSPFGDGGINAYAYCDNEPTMRQDPTGHVWQWVKPIARRLGIIKTTKQMDQTIDRLADRAARSLLKLDTQYEPRVVKPKELALIANTSTSTLISNSKKAIVNAEQQIAYANKIMARQYLTAKSDFFSLTSNKYHRPLERVSPSPSAIAAQRNVFQTLNSMSTPVKTKAFNTLDSTLNVLMELKKTRKAEVK